MDILKELKENGTLLQKIPKKDQTTDICKIAIEQDPLSLKFASRKCIDRQICMAAVQKDGRAFRYVPHQYITKDMCKLALASDPSLLKKVPEDLRGELFDDETEKELIEKIAEVNANWLMYMPNRPDVRNLWIKYMDRDFSIVQNMPDSIKKSEDILIHQKTTGKLQWLDKWYDSSDKKFKIKIKIVYGQEKYTSSFNENNIITHEFYYNVIGEYEQFDKFYDFLDGNLLDAELGDFNFDGINLSDYNIDGAVINSNILKEQGLYDDTYFSFVKESADNDEDDIIETHELTLPGDFFYPKPVDDGEHMELDFAHIPFFYVSDIHLTHKVCNHFKYQATKEEIFSYIKKLARDMVASIGTKPFFSYLVIAGDTSSIFEFSSIFYTELVKSWDSWGSKIIVIAGNHELLDPWVDMDKNIEAYRSFFDKLGIIFLQNDLFYLNQDLREYHIIHEPEILTMSETQLREKIKYSPVSVLGGIGFSGMSKEYNASNLSYGKSFDELPRNEALQKDIQETGRFSKVYLKLLKALYKDKIIVLTHTPKTNWSKDEYNPSWIYLNGHNHRNYSEINEERVIYADNQIGYKSNILGLKYFYCDNYYDIFEYYKDGVYEITKEQYIDFNRGKLTNMSFNRKDGTIYMLKRNDMYMFIINCKYTNRSWTDSLYLLNGGKLRKLNSAMEGDLSYYYNNLTKYADNVALLLEKYMGEQRKISEFIKNIGGCGKIHGCIVDIDKPEESGYSYNHLYVNPIDGKVTPYFAYDTGSRYVYKDLKTLLISRDECKLIAQNYINLEKKLNKNLPAIKYYEPDEDWINGEYIFDYGGYIYTISRVIRSLQYCIEQNIVRYWNEELLNYDFVDHIQKADQLTELADDKLIMDEEDC